MGEVKIWQARYRGELFILGAWNQGLRWGFNAKGDLRSFDFRTPFTDLTELELHPKGEGVWIEGVSAEELLDLLAKSQPDPRGENFENKWWEKFEVVTQILRDIVHGPAQLSPQPEAREEQVSLGECNGPHGVEEECPKHGADIKRRRYCSPSPAKVGIELSELENFSYLRGWLDHNQAGVMGDYGSPWFHFCVSLARQLFADYTPPTPPPVELPEPKGYTTFVRANEKGFLQRPKWQKNISNDLWCSDDGDQNVRWADLENPEIISPRVIGGEK